MSIIDNQRKLFWVTARKLRWTEAELRTALAQIAAKARINDLDRDSFGAMMGFFAYCGVTPLTAQGKAYGKRSGMARYALVVFMRTSWSECTRRKAGKDKPNRWPPHTT